MRIALSANARLRIDGIVWAVERRTSTGYQLVGVGDGALRVISDDEFLEKFREERLEQLHPSINPETARGANPHNEDFLCIPEKSRIEAERRAHFLDAFFKEAGPPPYCDRQLAELIPVVHLSAKMSGSPPSLRTLRRWLARQKLVGLHHPVDLLVQIPNPSRTQGNRAARFPAEVERLITETIETEILCHAPRTIDMAYARLFGAIEKENLVRPDDPLPRPSLRTFVRRIAALDDNVRTERQRSLQAARENYRQVQVAPREHIPLSVVEIDHNYVDCEIVDDNGVVLGRPTLTAAIDRATRMCVGFVLTWEPPSTTCTMLLLRHMIMDKSYVRTSFGDRVHHDWPCFGLPTEIVVDNGPDFHGNHFKNACTALGRIQLIFAEPADPQKRGMIERFFKSLNMGLIHLLPGTTLSRCDRKSDYDPSKAAKVPLTKLNFLLHKFICDIYAQRKHRGLKQSPIDAWNTGVEKYPPRLPRSARDVHILSCGKIERTLSRRGIELFSTYYRASEFAAVHIRNKGDIKVQAYYDPTDLARIWVQAPQEDRFIEATCVAEAYTQKLTIWQHRKVIAHLGAEARHSTEKELLRAKAELLNIIDEGKKRKSCRHKTKRAGARFAEQPKTPADLAQIEIDLPKYNSNEEAFAARRPSLASYVTPIPTNRADSEASVASIVEAAKCPLTRSPQNPNSLTMTVTGRAQSPSVSSLNDANDADALDAYIQRSGMTARRLR